MKFVPTNWPEEGRVLQRRVIFTLILVALYYFDFFAQSLPGGAVWFGALAAIQLLVNGLGVRNRWDALPTFNFFYDQLNVVFLIGISGGASSAAAFIVAMLLISELLWFARLELVPWLTGLQITNLVAGNLLATALGLGPSWKAVVALSVGLVIMAHYLVKPIGHLQRDAQLDPLTGVLNRRAGLSTLSAWVQNKRPFQLVFVDLKGFKEINDSYGHGVGDELLEAVAGRLGNSVRQDDLVIRYGGDEFLLGVYGTDSLAERLQHFSRNEYRTAVGTLTLHIDLGSARYPDEASGLSGLISIADGRMYSQKQRGPHVTSRNNLLGSTPE